MSSVTRFPPRNTFWLPEIIYDPTLVLSPHDVVLYAGFQVAKDQTG
jgi:uncharacterized protein DUF3435